MPRKAPVRHESHDRWLVSYADFVTLLFALFVVMFATGQEDRNRAKQVSESVRDALQNGRLSAAIANVISRAKAAETAHPRSGTAPAPEKPAASPPGVHPADLTQALEILQRDLQEQLANGHVGLKLEARGLVISLREAAFFASGNDVVVPQSDGSLEKIAAVIKGLPNPVRLEGHTDAVPIHTSRFRSNWDLSAARAIAMMDLLSDKFHVPRERMAIAGYAENAPADTNDTVEGRAHNRRVDVVLLSSEGVRGEPGTAPGSAPSSAPSSAAK